MNRFILMRVLLMVFPTMRSSIQSGMVVLSFGQAKYFMGPDSEKTSAKELIKILRVFSAEEGKVKRAA